MCLHTYTDFCGGVKTDLEGRTTLSNLFAAGEVCSHNPRKPHEHTHTHTQVACTGLHGANRLASTSLLEGLVWGAAIVDHLQTTPGSGTSAGSAELANNAGQAYEAYDTHPAGGVDKSEVARERLSDVRKLMWDKVGVVREEHRLAEAVTELKAVSEGADKLFRESALSPDTVGFRNAALTASLIAQSAHANPESRGTHYMKPAAASA